MVRRTRPPRPEATHAITLTPLKEDCEQCGQLLWVGYYAHRAVTKLDGLWRLTIVVRRCIQPECPGYHAAYRPEEEGGWALWRAPQCARDASHAADAWGEHHRAQCHPFDATLWANWSPCG